MQSRGAPPGQSRLAAASTSPLRPIGIKLNGDLWWNGFKAHCPRTEALSLLELSKYPEQIPWRLLYSRPALILSHPGAIQAAIQFRRR
jgi:hypothetical protein